jgi:hypothetical protein
MTDYIRREDALRAVQRQRGANRSPAQNEMLNRIKTDIIRAPAADVAPVAHGAWVHSRHDNCSEQFDVVKCSRCGLEAYAMAYHVRDGNYCPRCGARMDGGNGNG